MLKLILDKHFFIKKNINPDVVIKDFVSMQCNILVFLKIFSKIVSRKLYVIDYSLRCYLKSDSHLPKKNCFICFKESSLKVMINALFVLNFHLEFLATQKNSLVRKITLISKSMTSRPGEQRITVHILLNFSLSKCNQAMKLGHLIEYHKRNISLQKSCRKCGGGTSSRPVFVFPNKVYMK